MREYFLSLTTGASSKKALTRVGLSLAILLFFAQTMPSYAIAQEGSVDPTFLSGFGPNEAVTALAIQPDGKILIAGSFTTYRNSLRNNIARLNVDGSLDNSFNPNATFSLSQGPVSMLVLQPDGKILVGAGNIPTDSSIGVVRLNSDGSEDTSFRKLTGVSTTALALQADGKILVGYRVNSLGNKGLSRLNADGTIDSTFNPETPLSNNTIKVITTQSDGKILVVTRFVDGSGTVRPLGILRLNSNGSRDNTFDPGTGVNNTINSLVIQSDGKILVGGTFTTYNDITANRLIRLNSDGSPDATFNVGDGPEAAVNSIVLQNDGKIVIAGAFSLYKGQGVSRFLRLNSDASPDNTFTSGQADINNVINVAALQGDGKILLGGTFTRYSSTGINRIMRVNSNSSLDISFYPLPTGANDAVYTMAWQSDGKILVGGAFSEYTGKNTGHFIRLNSDGTLDTTFPYITNAKVNGDVKALVNLPSRKTLVAGDFTSYGGESVTRIVRLNKDGSRDNTFASNGAGANAKINAVVVQADGKILIGGDFTTYSGTNRNYLARLNSDGTLDTTFDPGLSTNGAVKALELQTDGKVLIAGDFTTFNNTPRNYLARLNSDGTLDSTFDSGAGANAVINALTVQNDGKILVAGAFTNFNNINRYLVARLNSDGSVDSSFNSATSANILANLNVFAIKLLPENKILLGGSFYSYKNSGQNGVVRLNSDGSVDSSFNTGLGITGGAAIYALEMQSDGKILVGGKFTAVDTTTRDNIVRLAGTPCNPLQVISKIDDGMATNCGTFSYALATATSGTTVTFALPQGSVINLIGSLSRDVRAGVTIDGGANGLTLIGNGTSGYGLRLSGGNTLQNLTIRGFAGRELVLLGTGNKLWRVKIVS